MRKRYLLEARAWILILATQPVWAVLIEGPENPWEALLLLYGTLGCGYVLHDWAWIYRTLREADDA